MQALFEYEGVIRIVLLLAVVLGVSLHKKHRTRALVGYSGVALIMMVLLSFHANVQVLAG